MKPGLDQTGACAARVPGSAARPDTFAGSDDMNEFSRPCGTSAIADLNPAVNCRAILNSPFGRYSPKNVQTPVDGETPVRATEVAALPALNRRNFLRTAAAAIGLSALANGAHATNTSVRSRDGLIDVNTNLFRWPSRRLPGDDTPTLVTLLRRQGVVQAWAGSFEGLLHKNIASVNARLAEECRRHGRGLLLPFGSINPKSPDWEEDLRRCVEEHRMPGIRLHPNYHGYKLDDPKFERLLRLAAQRGLTVQLALVMEDERMMHPLLRVEPVDTASLADLVKETSGLRLVLLNALRTLRGQALVDLIAAGEVYVEISMLEGVGGIANLLTHVPARRVLFGSHAPLFYFDSALLKLKESPLSEEQRRAIRRENARTSFIV